MYTHTHSGTCTYVKQKSPIHLRYTTLWPLQPPTRVQLECAYETKDHKRSERERTYKHGDFSYYIQAAIVEVGKAKSDEGRKHIPGGGGSGGSGGSGGV